MFQSLAFNQNAQCNSSGIGFASLMERLVPLHRLTLDSQLQLFHSVPNHRAQFGLWQGYGGKIQYDRRYRSIRRGGHGNQKARHSHVAGAAQFAVAEWIAVPLPP